MDALSTQPVKDDVTAPDRKPDPAKPSGGDLFMVANSDAELTNLLHRYCS